MRNVRGLIGTITTVVLVFLGAGAPAAEAIMGSPSAGVAAAAAVKQLPVVSAVSPSSGPTVGGTLVTISGTGFARSATVTFGTAAATVVSATASTVTVQVPAGAVGTVGVTVTTRQGSSAASTQSVYTYVLATTLAPVTALAAVPATTSIGLAWTPPVDPAYAGAVIRRAAGTVAPATPEEGSLVAELTTPDAVYADTGLKPDTAYAYAVFARDSAGHLAVPAAVTATTRAGKDTTLSVTGLSPSAGPSVGGTTVTISGSGFRNVTAVAFGAILATVHSSSTTALTVTTPAHAGGSVDVTVTAAGVTSVPSSLTRYTYTDTPDVTPPGRDCTTNGVSGPTRRHARRGRLVTDDHDKLEHELDAQGSEEDHHTWRG